MFPDCFRNTRLKDKRIFMYLQAAKKLIRCSGRLTFGLLQIQLILIENKPMRI